MKIYIAFTRKKIIIAFCLILILLSLAFQVSSIFSDTVKAETNAKRIKIINNIGVEVEENPNEKEIVVPNTFSSVYNNYNELQKKAGFDLSKYKGNSATVYTYKEKNSDRIVNLIVCNGVLIGGDITETALGGKMLPLLEKNDG